MHKNIHKFIALVLILLFQFPMWLQTLHSFEKHQAIHVCSANGATKHIHSTTSLSCSILHHPLNFHFTASTLIIELTFYSNSFNNFFIEVTNFSLQLIPFTLLRAPPFSFINN